MSVVVNGFEYDTGRVYTVSHVFGDSPEELENNALLEAQEFFGTGVRLIVPHSYIVSKVAGVLCEETDKRYVTSIAVYEVLP